MFWSFCEIVFRRVGWMFKLNKQFNEFAHPLPAQQSTHINTTRLQMNLDYFTLFYSPFPMRRGRCRAYGPGASAWRSAPRRSPCCRPRPPGRRAQRPGRRPAPWGGVSRCGWCDPADTGAGGCWKQRHNTEFIAERRQIEIILCLLLPGHSWYGDGPRILEWLLLLAVTAR